MRQILRQDNERLARFSVLISTYAGDVPEQLDSALKSIVRQTVPPDEIVLVKDGPISKRLSCIIDKWRMDYPHLFSIVSLPKNLGLGLALKAGMEECRHELIARMDADDISAPNRFEKQLRFLHQNRDVDVVSSWTAQFYDEPDSVLFVRPAPTRHEDISRLARFRSPITHAASMFHRSAVIRAGGYSHWRVMQDYQLWARMLLAGCRMACIPEALYKVRRSGGLATRRSGLRRACLQVLLQTHFLKMGFISLPTFLLNVTLRVIACVLPVGVMERLRIKFRI